MSRFASSGRPSKSAKYSASESSESGLLSPSQDYGVYSTGMAQLHPPYVMEARAVAVKERAADPKR